MINYTATLWNMTNNDNSKLSNNNNNNNKHLYSAI